MVPPPVSVAVTCSTDGSFEVGAGTSCIAVGTPESSPGMISPARVKPGGHTTLLYFRPGRTGVVGLVGFNAVLGEISIAARGFSLYLGVALVVLILNRKCSGTNPTGGSGAGNCV